MITYSYFDDHYSQNINNSPSQYANTHTQKTHYDYYRARSFLYDTWA